MINDRRSYFEDSPDPMWIHDTATMRFLDVNDAALHTYGYARGAFLAMTTPDLLQPRDDTDTPPDEAAGEPSGNGLCRHRLKSGAVIDVDVTAREIDYAGGRAMLVVARDATRLMAQQRQSAQLTQDLMHLSEELKQVDARREGKAAKLRMVQRLLKIGYLQVNITTGAANWSDELCDIYGIAREDFKNIQSAYTELIHPDDREATAAVLLEGIQSGARSIVFAHRIIRPQGGIIHVRGVVEVSTTPDGIVLNGGMQDVSDQIKAADDLREAAAMAALAGRVAKVGGWRLDLKPLVPIWSDEVAAIHDEPAGTKPGLETAINYFVPEDRPVITAAVSECAARGTPFDKVVQMVTARNRRIWVRSIGEPVFGDNGRIIALRGAFQDITEIVAARDGSAAMAVRLARTLQDMGEAFMILDSEWRYSFLNAEAERLLLRSHDDLVGKVFWDEFPLARGWPFQDEFERAVRIGKPVRFKAHYAEPLNMWFEVSANPTPEGLAVYFRDVTVEHHRSEQLRLLELSVSHLNDMLVITEAEPLDPPDGPRIVYVNDAVLQQTGYKREELIGSTPRRFQGPETQKSELKLIREAMETGSRIRAELVNYTRDRHAYWVEVSINPVTDETGKVSHMVAVQRDITDRKNAETALRLSEERFRLVSNSAQTVVWDWDIVTGVIWFNDNMKSIFGHAAGMCMSDDETWQGRVHPDDFEDVDAGLQAAIAGAAKGWEARYRYLKGNGQHVMIQDRAFFIRDADGKALRLVGSFRDVTDDVAREERERQSQKLEAMGQLTGGVAHDFNNLLTVILGTAELIAETSNDSYHRHLAEMAVASAERGAALTHRLLAFARKQPLLPSVVDINALVASVQDMLQRTLPENVELVLHLTNDLWLVELDANQLEVALLNLAINARDAMPGGGRLTIETANTHLDEAYAAAHSEVVPGDYVKVTVTDVGSGMTPEVVARVFEPFFTTKPEGVGSGLGLSMVYGFVKQSGGHIMIYSELGEGTAFRLYFPVSASRGKITETIRAENSVQGGHERILVVEDDDFVRQHLVGQLRAMGYHVVHAPDARRGLDILAVTPGFDMLLTDVIMPGGINGWQLSEMAREKVPGLKVLFTSGYSENALSHNGRLDPGVELLSKPFRRQELAAKVRKVLDN